MIRAIRFVFAALLFLAMVHPALAQAKKKLLLVGHPPDGHPPTTHEYTAGVRILGKLLEKVDGLEVTVVEAQGAWKNGPELIERSDGVVLFISEGAKWLQADPARHQAVTKVAQRGGGLTALHFALGSRDDVAPIAAWLKLFGGCHGGPDRKFTVVETEAELVGKHPILTGLANFKVKDEFYYKLKFVQPADSITPLVRVAIEGQKETVCWAWERADAGRSFGFSGLHFHENWRLPEYRRLVAQGVLWSLKLPIPRDGLPVDIKDEDLRLE